MSAGEFMQDRGVGDVIVGVGEVRVEAAKEGEEEL